MDDNQCVVAPSFVALYTRPGRNKPQLDAAAMGARYEYAEDLAQMLVDMAGQMQLSMGLHPSDVLDKVGQGLGGPEGLALKPAEQAWVLCRLAELRDWPLPELPAPGSAID